MISAETLDARTLRCLYVLKMGDAFAVLYTNLIDRPDFDNR